MRHEVYLGLGSNLGDSGSNVVEAVGHLAQVATNIVISSLYTSVPVGFTSQPTFVNAVCRIWTRLDPFELLHEVKKIQTSLSSSRTFVNGPRFFDIDILMFDNWVINMPNLVIPHPRMAEREFVLVPLAEISPDFVHPVLKKDSKTLLALLAVSGAVRKL